jgi:outer membrane protein assembly factor BamB
MDGRSLVVAALLLGATGLVRAENWPQFRGSNAGVAADDAALPDRWSATENIAWIADVAGTGWGSPVVWNDYVFVTSVVSAAPTEPPRPGLYTGGERPAPASLHRWIVYAFDAGTGKIRWQQELRRGLPPGPRHVKNSYASETPATDGQRVFVYFGNVGLFALDFDGKVIWSAAVGPFRTRNGWGTGASPVVHGSRVYLVADNDDRSFVAAFDSRTGKEVWRVERQEGTNWSTPFVWANDRRTELVTAGSDKVRSYDLDGRLLWELSGMSSITIPTPFARHGLLFLSSGYVGDALRPTYAIRPGATGDISLPKGETTSAFVAWSHPTIAPYNPTPLAYGDHLYTLLDRGFLLCHEATTGKEIYGRQRISADETGFTSSPWAYNGKVFALSEDGNTYVIQAGPEFKVVGRNPIGEMTLATPAVANGSVFIRTASKLYRITQSRQPG